MSDLTYNWFLSGISEIVREATAVRRNLFTTNVPNLWDTFLTNLPQEMRAHYTCRTCRKFVESYGGLVYINNIGEQVPLVWDLNRARDPFTQAIFALHSAVNAAKITGVFLTSNPIWGVPSNVGTKGETWRHMSAVCGSASLRPRRLGVTVQTDDQAMAEKLEDFRMLKSAILKFTPTTVEKAYTLLTSDVLYRSEKCREIGKWFLELRQRLASTRVPATQERFVWEAVASAPAGFCHISSGMIGTLLEDVQDSLPVNEIAARFATKMAPGNYQRAQVAPTVGNIAQAEKTIAELGLVPSLARRYATIQELPKEAWVWRAHGVRLPVAPTGGVFGHITPKAPVAPTPPAMVLPEQTMTWAKFQRTVLPNAQSIQLKIPSSTDRFVGLVTAANPEAPPILQWDREDARNPFSWYYSAGIDADIRKRVLEAGGRYEDNDIRCSLIWNQRHDLDLHCITPTGEEIYFGHKNGRCQGALDVDRNVHGETETPVENIRWARGSARTGTYRFFVENYQFHGRIEPIPFRVELEVGGQIYSYSNTIPAGMKHTASRKYAFEFSYVPGQAPRFVDDSPQSVSTIITWGAAPGTYRKVAGVVKSPNMWGPNPLPTHGDHTIFLLEGFGNAQDPRARGFFTETLRSELRPYRATLEAYTASARIEGGDRADAFGIGVKGASPWDLSLRVRTQAATADYRIDRED